VVVQDSNGVATIKYECTAGEVVRSFALDVSLDKGRIVGISNFFRGVSGVGAQGYGIFPAAFRDHVTVSSGTNANWDVSDYTPLAVVADSPGNTLPGLNSAGVTLEFGGLWDGNTPAAFPAASGTLCTLQISEAAQVSIAANASRGGVVSAIPDLNITPVFVGTFVDPSVIITGIQRVGGTTRGWWPLDGHRKQQWDLHRPGRARPGEVLSCSSSLIRREKQTKHFLARDVSYAGRKPGLGG
jgi:hypothetical protein